MEPLPEALLRVLDRFGFVPEQGGTRWRFDGHPSRGTTIELFLEEAGGARAFRLEIAEFPGGEGYEEEVRAPPLPLAELIAKLEVHCATAVEPYVKTRLQKRFEPWIGHDAACALFYRPPKK